MEQNEPRKVDVTITDEGPLVVEAIGVAGRWWGVSRTTELACKVVATATFGDAPDEWRGDGSPYTFAWDSKAAAMMSFAEKERIWTLMIRAGINYDSVELAIDYYDNGYTGAELKRVLVEVEGFSHSTSDVLIKQLERLN